MRSPTRRDFLATSGTAAAGLTASLGAETSPPASAAGRRKGYRRTRFTAAPGPVQLSENLWLIEDTCNVYLVRDGDRGCLIDFGSGKVLDHLSRLGINKIDWILHTHHHRDQCQGDWKAVEARIPIAVPAHESYLFSQVENFWRNRRIFHLYYMKNDFNTLTESVPVAQRLLDYSTLEWGRFRFFILPAPGHTPGSIAPVVEIDGKKVAFTGDLMYAPGKILNLYDTQIAYGGAEGIDFGIGSLARLRELNPDLVCPSHGSPISDPGPAIGKTVDRLVDYYRFQSGEPSEFNRPYAVSPHLVAHHQTTSSFYAVISNSGKGFFIDYGSASWNYFGIFEKATAVDDRIRFVEHSIDNLKRNFGLKSVDVAMPSHTHDDHVNGFPHLIRKYGTQVWCYENMVDIFENPRGYNLGCILGEPFKVSRTFRDKETFRWEEFEFEVRHSPGHTEYQMALHAKIDGSRVAFSGDAFFDTEPGKGAMRHNIIFRNHVENDSHLKSIESLIEHEPEILCPGHGKPFAVNRERMVATLDKFKRQQEFFFDLLPEGETDFALDPGWVSIYPYQIVAAPGGVNRLELRVRNYRPQKMKIELALLTPAEWQVDPESVTIEVPGRASASHPIAMRIPDGWEAPLPRMAITADVVADGKYLGELTEAVVEFGGG